MSIDPGEPRALDESDYATYDREAHPHCARRGCDNVFCMSTTCACGLPKGVTMEDPYCGADCVESVIVDYCKPLEDEDITSPARLDADVGDGYEAQMLRAFRGLAVRP